MWKEVNSRFIVNPVEVEGETVFVPVEEAPIERDYLERRPAHGRVRWYSRSLGYGFIWEDGNSEDIFVHQTSIQIPGIRKLRSGQRVLFEYCTMPTGNLAINVIPIMEREETLLRYREKLEKSANND